MTCRHFSDHPRVAPGEAADAVGTGAGGRRAGGVRGRVLGGSGFVAAAWLAAVCPAAAQDGAPPMAKPAPATVSDATSEATPPRPPPDIEGAIGLLLHVNPEYQGARRYAPRLTPAGFLRWGRITITGAGGFTTRRHDDVERGLGAELVRRESVRVKLGLRLDNGRQENDSARLAGMGDVKRTVRARLSAQWDVAPGWRVGAGASVDALNQGGGYVLDVAASHEWALPGAATLTAGAAFSAAGDRYLQTWYGVTPEQAQRTGLPVYSPREGPLSASASLTWRAELGPRWAGFVSGGVNHLLGGAAHSPLTERRTSANASAGLVWRF